MDLHKPFPDKMPELPYAMNALEPFISETTLSFHYGKHHKGYFDKAKAALAGTNYAKMELVDVLRKSVKEDMGLFNNIAQTWNHSFYWHSLRSEKMEMGTKMKEFIVRDFGSFEAFSDEFAKAAAGQFGSGWAWLVEDKGALKIIKTANADNPIIMGLNPILTIDVWEHAYYLDFQNRRPDYIAAFLNSLVNWKFAEGNLETALKMVAANVA